MRDDVGIDHYRFLLILHQRDALCASPTVLWGDIGVKPSGFTAPTFRFGQGQHIGLPLLLSLVVFLHVFTSPAFSRKR